MIYMAKLIDPPLFVVDVYDIAAGIGKEFEKLIELCGPEKIESLMSQVIRALEDLESSTVVIGDLRHELSDIRTRVNHLEREKVHRSEFRSKLDQEIESIEENWSREINHLNTLVVRLQEENQRLSKVITEKEKHPTDDCRAFMSDEELLVVQKLKELAEQQRKQLISKDKELLEKSNDLKKVQYDNEKLTKVYNELTQRNRQLQKQLHTSVEEKIDLQANIQCHEKEFQELESKLKAAVKENIDLSSAGDKDKLDLRGKIIYHLDDPNRPRFTLDELRDILYERNDLKAKVSDLEDELSLLKKKDDPNLHKKKDVPSSQSFISLSSFDQDLPVQGPINKEPDEKLFPEKKKLGIKRFFDFLRR